MHAKKEIVATFVWNGYAENQIRTKCCTANKQAYVFGNFEFKNILFPTFTQQRPTFENRIIYKPIVLQNPSHKPKPFCTIVNIHHENKSYTSSIYYMILCILIQTNQVIQDWLTSNLCCRPIVRWLRIEKKLWTQQTVCKIQNSNWSHYLHSYWLSFY